MTIEKLQSGNYRVRKQVNGKRYSITLPYKPSKKEAEQLISEKINGKDKLKKTFGECANECINGKSHTISPSTVRGYESILGMIPETITNAPIGSITSWDIQVYIDSLSARGLEPKTVKNYHAFISSVFSAFLPDMELSTKLPQEVENGKYVPTDEEVKRIFEYLKEKDATYEVPIRLACYSLRRSEICALTMDDLNGNLLDVNKAYVQGKDRVWYIKSTKTTKSARTIYIDDYLRDLINERGMYKGYPNRIYWHLQKAQKKLGIQRFPLHNLRHYFASFAHSIGVPDAAIMEAGGWKTDHVMKRVYRHAQDIEAKQKAIADHLKNL